MSGGGKESGLVRGDAAEVIKTGELNPPPRNLLFDYVAGSRYQWKRRRMAVRAVLLLLYCTPEKPRNFRHQLLLRDQPPPFKPT